MKRLFAVLALLLVVGPTIATAAPTAEYCATPEEINFLNLVNAYRLGAGLVPLALSQTLGAASEHHSWSMAESGLFSHTLSEPDGPLVTWDQNVLNHGYPALNAQGLKTRRAEVLTAGIPDAWRAFDALRRSPAHNAILLAPWARAIGVGLADAPGSRYRWWWTATFGSTFDRVGVVCR